jgi:hypothetical protein
MYQWHNTLTCTLIPHRNQVTTIRQWIEPLTTSNRQLNLSLPIARLGTLLQCYSTLRHLLAVPYCQITTTYRTLEPLTTFTQYLDLNLSPAPSPNLRQISIGSHEATISTDKSILQRRLHLPTLRYVARCAGKSIPMQGIYTGTIHATAPSDPAKTQNLGVLNATKSSLGLIT